MKIGIDTLFLPKYVDLVKNEIPQGWYFSTFGNLFGIPTAFGAVREVLKTGRPAGVKIQVVWEDNHNYEPKKHNKIIFEAHKEALKLAKDFPSAEILFSPVCEVNQNLSALFLDLAKADPKTTLTYVNSVNKGVRFIIPNTLTEVHKEGNPKPFSTPFSFGYDGVSATGQDIKKDRELYKNAEHFWYWEAWMNLKYKDDDKTPRDKRTYRPKSIHFDSIVALTREVEKQKLSPDYISKPMSEDVGDAKSNKLVFVAKGKYPEIKFTATNSNQVIDTAKYFSPFSGGGHRYYATMAGFQIADKALKISKSRLVNVVIDGKKIGTINPSFRAGKMR